MGIGFEYHSKKAERDSDRGAAYGAWVSKYGAEQRQSRSWQSADPKKGGKGPTEGPWGPVFKSKQNFVDMHFC